MEKENLLGAFLSRKNIDAAAFSLQEPKLFREWQQLFAQVHEESFVMMRKFQLNPIRRRFPLISHAAVNPVRATEEL